MATDVLRRSYEEALAFAPRCGICLEKMAISDVPRVSFTAFRPFNTSAFNSLDDAPDKEIAVNDRSQLRRLLRTHKMIEKGDRDSRKDVFGSSPKSLPSWQEVSSARTERFSPVTRRMLKKGMVGAIDAKSWGRMSEGAGVAMTEREEKVLYKIRNG
jgi:hypothetical protein